MVKAKPNPLAAAMADTTATVEADSAPKAPKPEAEPLSAKRSKASSRENTVLIGGHFPVEMQKQLRMIAAEEGTTNQALLAEALNLLFQKKGKAAIGV